MPKIKPSATDSSDLSDNNEFDVLDEFDEQGTSISDSRHQLISILKKGDEAALNNWLVKLNRSWKQEEIISDVLFLALQCSSFPFILSLFTKVFTELNITNANDSPTFVKESDLLKFHYDARNFKISFKDFIQKALLPKDSVVEEKEELQGPIIDENNVHLLSKKGISLVFNTLFKWVETVSTERFSLLKDSALNKCGRPSFWGWGFWRNRDIEAYFQKYDTISALVLIFAQGRTTSLANEHLFLTIMNEIKKDIKENPELEKDPGYALIALFNEPEHKLFYLSQMDNAMIEFQAKTQSELLISITI